MPDRRARLAALVLAAALLGGEPGCAPGATSGPQTPPREGPPQLHWGDPKRVELRGYRGDAMEPFLTRDGQTLLFNNRNDPAVNTELHYAERRGELRFDYRGPVLGVNTPALEGAPSVDRSGRLFFVTTRAYEQTGLTIFAGRFAGGAVRSVGPVAGISRAEPGWVNFDVDVSPDGATLYYVDSWFGPRGQPQTANLVVAQRDGDGFAPLSSSRILLAAVNSRALEYAPCISADGLELYFTRWQPARGVPGILVATRSDPSAAFGLPRRVQAAEGYVEGPTLSPDGRRLYFHKKVGNRFEIFRVER